MTWAVPADSIVKRLVVTSEQGIVVDTTLAGGGTASTGVLPPGAYVYRVEATDGTPLSDGRFDVTAATAEMRPAPVLPVPISGAGPALDTEDGRSGRPLRTTGWPYLLVIILLCLEWVGRRRTGLR